MRRNGHATTRRNGNRSQPPPPVETPGCSSASDAETFSSSGTVSTFATGPGTTKHHVNSHFFPHRYSTPSFRRPPTDVSNHHTMRRASAATKPASNAANRASFDAAALEEAFSPQNGAGVERDHRTNGRGPTDDAPDDEQKVTPGRREKTSATVSEASAAASARKSASKPPLGAMESLHRVVAATNPRVLLNPTSQKPARRGVTPSTIDAAAQDIIDDAPSPIRKIQSLLSSIQPAVAAAAAAGTPRQRLQYTPKQQPTPHDSKIPPPPYMPAFSTPSELLKRRMTAAAATPFSGEALLNSAAGRAAKSFAAAAVDAASRRNIENSDTFADASPAATTTSPPLDNNNATDHQQASSQPSSQNGNTKATSESRSTGPGFSTGSPRTADMTDDEATRQRDLAETYATDDGETFLTDTYATHVTTHQQDQEDDARNDLDDCYDLVDQADAQERTDAALHIQYGSPIMIRLCYPTRGAASCLCVSQPVEDSDKTANEQGDGLFNDDSDVNADGRKIPLEATLDGMGIGHATECFYVVPADVATDAGDIIRYGDIVTLHAPAAGDRAVGCRAIDPAGQHSSDGAHAPAAVGFFRTILGQAEKWMVLRAPLSRRGADANFITVGPIAVQTSTVPPPLEVADGDGHVCRRSAVRMGDAIVLRNVHHGGLLSLSSSHLAVPAGLKLRPGKMTLLTSAYQQTIDGTAEIEGGKTSIEYVQRQHRVVPSATEIFQFVDIASPPGVPWLGERSGTSGVGLPRYFLNGTYLLYDQRHSMSDEMTEDLFRSQSTLRVLRHQGKSHQRQHGGKISLLRLKPVKSQEHTLIGEIFGAMLGLEGEYIRSELSTDLDANDQDFGEESNAPQQRAPGLPDRWDRIFDVQFVLNPDATDGIDPGLRKMVENLLPHCSCFAHVNAFVASRGTSHIHGAVVHALCESMETVLEEYMRRVNFLEQAFRTGSGLDSNGSSYSGEWTMSRLQVTIQSALRTISILRRVASVVLASKGGELLNVLDDMLATEVVGDDQSQSVVEYLLDKASLPYMVMMQKWLDDGVLHDPYGEFMVCRVDESGITTGDIAATSSGDDWATWFDFRQPHILRQLLGANEPSRPRQGKSGTVDLAQRVLDTGKYLSAIRRCAEEDEELLRHGYSADNDVDVTTSFFGLGRDQDEQDGRVTPGVNRRNLAKYIEEAYASASARLMNLMMNQHRLMDALQMMKRYFLLDQGDFFVCFLDMAEDELVKEMTIMSCGRVESWLKIAVQMCGGGESRTHGRDAQSGMTNATATLPNMLRCDFAPQNLLDQLDALHSRQGGIQSFEDLTTSRDLYGAANRGLTGMEALRLDFQYVPFPISLVLTRKAISNYQLIFRHLFFAKHVERRLVGTWLDHQIIKDLHEMRKLLGPTFFLRQRMLHFVQNLVYYMMFEVIGPNFHRVEQQLKQSCGMQYTADQGGFPNQTVDDVVQIHQEFLIQTLDACLLTDRDLIHLLTKLMKTCILFSDQMKLFMETTEIATKVKSFAVEERHRRIQLSQEASSLTSPIPTRNRKGGTAKSRREEQMACMASERKERRRKLQQRIESALESDSYRRMIRRFDEVFTANLLEFMEQLQNGGGASEDGTRSRGGYLGAAHLANLRTRLDYNGFLTQSMSL